MDNNVIKVCITCGPLNIDQVYIQPSNGKKFCRKCCSESRKRTLSRNPEKYAAHKIKFRYIEREPNISSMRCCRCKLDKKIECFSPYFFNIRYPTCKECGSEQARKTNSRLEVKERNKRKYESDNKRKSRDASYRKKYGITLLEYEKLLEDQEYLCKICKGQRSQKSQDRNLDVDHCHETNKIRGLLCNRCNQGLGGFEDSIHLLILAAKYLEENG